MKNIAILFLVLSVYASCKKADEPAIHYVEPALAPIEKLNVIVPKNLDLPAPPQGDPTYNVMGFGYDVTGKFDAPSAVRGQVVDIAAYVNKEKPNNFVPWTSTSSGFVCYDADNAELLAKKFSDVSLISNNRNLYGGTIAEFFPGTTTLLEKHAYGYYSLDLKFKQFRFFVTEPLIAKFRAYLTPSFQLDVQQLSPEMIVNKYGTEVLAEIVLGAKLDILYRAEIDADNRSEIQQNGYDAAITTTFGLLVNRAFNKIDSAKLREAKSPTLSFSVTGGDPSLINVVEGVNGTKVDVTKWMNTAYSGNHSLITATSTIPLGNLIVNQEKRNAVERYIAEYLLQKQVKLSK